ncbi:hypothetical protein [Streptomyces sp. NPDC090022]|uniref:hypothetical protein n=1 Tax=Streptomyces sp. NPDC090022 TaxID=3365920 RepID=UPI00381FA2A5
MNAAAGAIHASMQQGKRLPAALAYDLEAMGLLQSPETAAELDRLRARVEELETFAHGCDGEGCTLPHSSWCTKAKEFAAQHEGCTCGRPWESTPEPHAGHCWLLSPPHDEVQRLRARVAELEALRPAPIQDCRKCGAGYTHGQPCSNCQFQAEMAAATVERNGAGLSEVELRRTAPGTYRCTCGHWDNVHGPFCFAEACECGNFAYPQPAEDQHEGPKPHAYRLGRDLPEYPRG